MSEKIEPALSAEEWKHAQESGRHGHGVRAVEIYREIAHLNAALLDSDPRKITRGQIERLRRAVAIAVSESRDSDASFGLMLLDALESYLPPEGT
jgi:hypothetical protein